MERHASIVLPERLFIALLCSRHIAVAPAVARKSKDLTVNILEQYFEQNILNRDFRVYRHQPGNWYYFPLMTAIYSACWKYELWRPDDRIKTARYLYTGKFLGKLTNKTLGKLVITWIPQLLPAEFVFPQPSMAFYGRVPIMKLAPR